MSTVLLEMTCQGSYLHGFLGGLCVYVCAYFLFNGITICLIFQGYHQGLKTIMIRFSSGYSHQVEVGSCSLATREVEGTIQKSHPHSKGKRMPILTVCYKHQQSIEGGFMGYHYSKYSSNFGLGG